MPQIINTNIASINAQRNLDKSQSANQTALQRLSSGLRINSAKDDAAGLAISTRFTSQIKGLNVAVRNAGDGIALAQTAEGALGSINENLQRIRELSVQSANATNSDVDRDALQAEVDQLVAEISRTAEETDFNGRKLLDGSFSATFQIGANAGQTLDVSIAELTADKLGSSSQAGVSAQGTSEKLSNGDLVINGEGIRASVAGDDELSFTDKEKSAIAKVAAINDVADVTGVTATVDANVVVGADMDSAGDASGGTTVTLNGVAIEIQGTDNTSEAAKAGTRGSVIAAINAKAEQTGVTASDGGKDGGVILTAADGRNITIDGAATNLADYGLADADTGVNTAETHYAGFTLTAQNANTDIVISGGNDTGNGNIENSGLAAGTYSAQTASSSTTKQEVGGTAGVTTVSTTAQTDVLAEAEATAAGITIDVTVTGAATQADLQAAFDAAGYDDITVGGNTQEDVAIAANAAKASEKRLDSGDLTINGVSIQASTSLDDTASDTTAGSSDAAASGIAIAAAINKSTEDTGVTAEANATEVVGGSKTDLLNAGALRFGATAGAVTAGESIRLTINNVAVDITETGDYEKNKANAIAAINEVSGQTGVVASDNGESLTLTAADGRNISLFADSATASESVTDLGTDIRNFGLGTDSVGVDSGATTVDAYSYASGAKTTYSTVTLSSASAYEVGIGTNGTTGLEDSGFKAGVYGGGEDGQALTDIDISTFEGAQDALVAVDNAIAQVASQRADLGAVQNRMESTVSNLQITSENLNSANSRIQDADFAAETAELQRTNVLQQAGISVLAQANAAGQQVLSLLG
ncbi:flagellin N-terminal helical domain-containing protein [Bacterioplanoides pacificum]|uniref:Flagellin n=1 Tax=Bacterioplanoides pacificum TaxID=1171596 RepID=A0ABV7VP49_9GAMM